MVLQPDERRGQAAPGQDLDQPGRVPTVEPEPACLDRAGHPVEPDVGQRVELRPRHQRAGVDRFGVGEQHLVGQTAGGREDSAGVSVGVAIGHETARARAATAAWR